MNGNHDDEPGVTSEEPLKKDVILRATKTTINIEDAGRRRTLSNDCMEEEIKSFVETQLNAIVRLLGESNTPEKKESDLVDILYNYSPSLGKTVGRFKGADETFGRRASFFDGFTDDIRKNSSSMLQNTSILKKRPPSLSSQSALSSTFSDIFAFEEGISRVDASQPNPTKKIKLSHHSEPSTPLHHVSTVEHSQEPKLSLSRSVDNTPISSITRTVLSTPSRSSQNSSNTNKVSCSTFIPTSSVPVNIRKTPKLPKTVTIMVNTQNNSDDTHVKRLFHLPSPTSSKSARPPRKISHHHATRTSNFVSSSSKKQTLPSTPLNDIPPNVMVASHSKNLSSSAPVSPIVRTDSRDNVFVANISEKSHISGKSCPPTPTIFSSKGSEPPKIPSDAFLLFPTPKKLKPQASQYLASKSIAVPSTVRSSKHSVNETRSQSIPNARDEHARVPPRLSNFPDSPFQNLQRRKKIEVCLEECSQNGYAVSRNVSGMSALRRKQTKRKGQDDTSLQYRRVVVNNVSEEKYITPSGGYAFQKVITTTEENSEYNFTIYLRDVWTSTDVEEGDIVNVIGRVEPKENVYIVNREKNTIIVQPDFLITGTALSSAVVCLRKAYFTLRSRPLSALPGRAQVLGTMIHVVVQDAMEKRDFSDETLESLVKNVVDSHLELVVSAEMTPEVSIKSLNEYIPVIKEWGQRYVTDTPQGNVIIDRESVKMAVRAVEVEDSHYSVMYGMKGNIDVSVQGTVTSGVFTGEKQQLMPMEIKSGKSSLSYESQVILYALLMSDRYQMDIRVGLLFSLGDKAMHGIRVNRNVISGVIQLRNRIAKYLSISTMPPVEQNLHRCQSCFFADQCTLLHRAAEKGDEKSFGIPNLFTKHTSHLTPSHSEFLANWGKLITLEERLYDKEASDVWSKPVSELKANGKALFDLVIRSIRRDGTCYIYGFANKDQSYFSPFSVSFLEGEKVVLSACSDKFTSKYFLCSGTISSFTEHELTITTMRKLKVPPLPQELTISSQRFEPFLSSPPDPDMELKENSLRDVFWRVDKYSLSSSYRAHRANLSNLMTNTPDNKFQRIRELVVDLCPPQFKNQNEEYLFESSVFTPCGVNVNNLELNDCQREASDKVFRCEDYTLIQGMPGTGKTTTVALIIRSLANAGKKVLLTAYTHNAVDNICLKLLEFGVDFLRVRPSASLSVRFPQLLPHALPGQPTMEQLRKALKETAVYASTCLATTSYIISSQRFDYCIVDEASQISLPVCLGPLFLSKRFVLVGDHKQLPPLVRNDEAKDSGFALSLFKRLCDAHPASVVTLCYQYRMNRDIMSVSNSFVYENKLRCGNEIVANKLLDIPNSTNIPSLIPGASEDWILYALKPSNSVIFFNTDMIPGRETCISDMVHNEVESVLVSILARALVDVGVSRQDIGIISPLRAQLKSIQHQLNKKNVSDRSKIEVNTVDTYQGRDKECIIVSLVRSNPQGKVGSLLDDIRRINVAFTRARRKMIVIGSRDTLVNNLTFARLFRLLDENGWCYDLPPNAHHFYYNKG